MSTGSVFGCHAAWAWAWAAAVVVALGWGAPAAAQPYGWLSLCGKCLSPSITRTSGLGTAKAVAEGKITRKDVEGWCGSWEPQDVPGCVRRELQSADLAKTYRATADCKVGRITAIDGETYTLAGTWADDVGKGRSKWRNAAGSVVGQDNASNGLAISQQWEVLCPAGAAAATPPTGAPPAGTRPDTAMPAPKGALYAVGEIVEAKYGRDWVRGRVDKIRQMEGASGLVIEYDVRLDNGQRGILPPRMLRKAQ